MLSQNEANRQVLLAAYRGALLRITDGKAATFASENGTRSVTEVDAPELRRTIQLLERESHTAGRAQHNVLLPNFNHTK